MKKQEYIAPELKIVEIKVEKGFADSDTTTTHFLGMELYSLDGDGFWDHPVGGSRGGNGNFKKY